ncbi:MAG: NAD(P)-dependent oxidoreductase [Acidiferrobacterales bacterium]|nr:NAD(P)-dependent oxidoreductase [Acidiferrobacterales bacterium]
MAVFITGGYGHIASWTALLLARQGQKVILYDKVHRGLDYLDEVAEHISFVKGDVLDLATLRAALEQYHTTLDGIIHTVGVMGELVLLNPHYHVTLNIMGLANVLELARVLGIKKVLYTSTGAVYGTVEGVADETQVPNPTDLYAATKISAEYLGIHYGQAFGLDFRIARLFFVYGPGKYPSQFISLYKIAFGVLEGIKQLSIDKGADQNSISPTSRMLRVALRCCSTLRIHVTTYSTSPLARPTAWVRSSSWLNGTRTSPCQRRSALVSSCGAAKRSTSVAR